MKRIRKLWPRLVRGLLSLSVLLGVCAMLFPLPVAPLPPNSPEKDSSEPFPCQNRPCGCRSAEQCWKKCCCFNNAQKVAWAKANNVKVPEFVLVAAKNETEDAANPEECSSTVSHKRQSSAAKHTVSCEHCAKKSVAAVKPSCCKKAGDSSSDDTSVAAKQGSCDSCVASEKNCAEVKFKPSKPSKWVLAIYAAECQGQGPPAFCFPVSIIPERISLVMPTVVEIETVPLESERLQHASLRPPLPPPKIV
jgi:hypothetical protein